MEQADVMNWFMLCDLNASITARSWEQCMSEGRVRGQFGESCTETALDRFPWVCSPEFHFHKTADVPACPSSQN